MNDRLYFRMKMLQAEIEMQGMVAENQCRVSNGENPVYGEVEFNSLIEKHGIHHNNFPFMGEGTI